MPVLYDQFNRPIEKRKLPERRPLAAAPILDTWRDYVTSGLTPERLASIFKEADAGDMSRQAALFDQMEEKDAHILGEKSKRQNVILDVEFKVTPASDDSRDQKVAEFVQTYLDNLTDYEDVLVSLQDGVGKGYSSLEVNWDMSEGQALPSGLEFIEQKRFLFTDMKGILRTTPLLVTDDDPMGVEIPAWKTVFHRYGGKSGHPTRSGIYRVCAWMFLFKNYSIKDWVIFCEVYGMPLRLGKYSPGASEDDKDALITAISTLGSDAAGIISKTTEIEFIENAKGRATGDLYKALADFANAENSKAILGQTLSAEVGDKRSYAAAKVHDGVRVDLLKADSRAVAATIRHQLIRPIVGFNYGWDTPCPLYEAPWEEEEDLKEKAEWIASLLEHNVEIPVSFVRKEFGIPEPEEGEAVVGQRAESVGHRAESREHRAKRRIVAKSRRFTPQQEKVEGLVAETQKEAEKALSGILGPVKELVLNATSLEEIRDGILDIYPDLDPSDLEELTARAMFVADLFGRMTVAE